MFSFLEFQRGWYRHHTRRSFLPYCWPLPIDRPPLPPHLSLFVSLSLVCVSPLQLLLAAGYFRARIKGLSPFDKIVGGMVWCITAANEDVDVDILFEENASIGKKM